MARPSCPLRSHYSSNSSRERIVLHPSMAAGLGAEALVAAGAGAAAEPVNWLTQLGGEDAGALLQVYLITFSRILPAAATLNNLRNLSDVTRSDLASMIRDAVNNPIVNTGRPRGGDGCFVDKLVVFQETHEDGSRHFHVAMKLDRQMRFLPIKRTLRERHRLCSHWSCSHRQWWSAVRYGAIPSPRKSDVDGNPFQWVANGALLDLFDESQEPFCASAWKARREKRDCEASKQDKAATFGKLDLTAVVLSKGLRSRAAVLAYAQEHGTAAMQAFVNKSQRCLDKHIEDAVEWGRAREDAGRERETDWALICRTADGLCPFGVACEYGRAASVIFDANSTSFRQCDLAAALRAVVIVGPSKTTRVPFLVGPPNCGKSTLLYPIDDVFGFQAVFHKPALTDVNYPLRNWLKSKRFAFWDDVRPVEYAEANVVPVADFLSMFNGDPFEIRVPQNTHDGNVDFMWKRGVAFTGKRDGLWTPSRRVSLEDINHMKARVLQFELTHQMQQCSSVARCSRCMCRWIVDGAAEHDARNAVRAAPAALGQAGAEEVEGLGALLQTAHLREEVQRLLAADVVATGALHVNELRHADWLMLPAWRTLRDMEQRRLLRSLGLA